MDGMDGREPRTADQDHRGVWPVGEVARIAGVTIRTLHHYDRIGLLVPQLRTSAGYREYRYADLVRLQHVLAYRELGFGLDQIKDLLDNPDADPVRVLRGQHAAVLARMKRLRQIAAVLERTMEARKMGINLTPDELLEVFGEDRPEQYAQETEDRWGETVAYQQSQRRTSSYSKDDWVQITAEQEAVEARFAQLLTDGVAADSTGAMDAAEAHRQQISRWFYDCPIGMHTGLAAMYLADPRFTAHYEQRATGLAQFVHDAIQANAERAVPDVA